MHKYFFITLFVFAIANSNGQISPGELSIAHASLEGMSNCIKCHDLGDKVSSKKCLDCHTEIKSLVSQNRGYHSNVNVKNKECISCHSEHHGRTFDMTRFDEKQFDHNLTKYKLEGQHAKIDCRDCHKSDNIKDPEIKKRQNTYLGLDKKCLSCHDDFHQKTLSNDCIKCHDFEAFRPASLFDHNKTDFKLKGKHIEVKCDLCHEMGTKNGKEFQIFADIPHNKCSDCHSDPHQDNFVNSCAECHTENSFTDFIGRKNFNHNKTNFTLKGKHNNLDCFKCHKNTMDPATIFNDLIAVKENDCASCHKDVHETKFGNDCAKCHTEKGFTSMRTMDFFNHNLTDYPLEGKHINVDCKKCHTEKTTKEIDFTRCSNCHTDYHEGEFIKNGIIEDCDNCHSLTAGFNVSLYTIERHQTNNFKLEGAHSAIPCSECHLIEKKWKFKNIGNTCIDCHDNPHGDRFQRDGSTDCQRCHTTNSWNPEKFNHDETKFPLEGKHRDLECISCHYTTYVENDKVRTNYTINSFECIDCHQ
ncbi:MAG TPA: hypothetical protein PKM97_02470 [Bacteroidia bacterium]|nr:hypothetical protein [Bacteroidia bacterium]